MRNKKSKEKTKNKKDKPIQKSVSDILPFVGIDKGIFLMADDSYVDIMQITSKDLISASDSDIQFDMLQFEKFYKMYADDCKIIGLNFPTDTKRQQQYYMHKIEACKNPVYKEMLQIKLAELTDINLYCTDREYYLMLFCKNYDKYLESRNIIAVTLQSVGLIREIDVEHKVEIITKLCNKSTTIFN